MYSTICLFGTPTGSVKEMRDYLPREKKKESAGAHGEGGSHEA